MAVTLITENNVSRNLETYEALETKGVEKASKYEGATKKLMNIGDTFENAGQIWKILDQNEEDTLIVALDDNGNEKSRFVVAWGLQNDGTWNQGHYFQDRDKATKFFQNRVSEIEKLVTESIDAEETSKLCGYTVKKSDKLPEFRSGLWIRIRRNDQIKAEYYTFVNDATAKECYKGIVSGVVDPEDISDIALGYTASDNSEQIRWQDYADNFTPHIEPEVKTEGGITMSDDYMVGDGESGRIYHGIADTISVIRNILTSSGEQVVAQNISLSDDSKIVTEDKELTEDPSAALEKIGYKQTRNKDGEIRYTSDTLYSPEISVFGSTIDVIPLTDLPISLTVEDHGKLVARLAQIQKVLEDLR